MYVYLDGAIDGGTLPANLSAILPKLTTLSCYGCSLTVRCSRPALLQLAGCHCSSCWLLCRVPSRQSGSQPENSLPFMGWLGLYGNQLTGTLPSQWGMPNLQWLQACPPCTLHLEPGCWPHLGMALTGRTRAGVRQ